jgi:hypothetical protein
MCLNETYNKILMYKHLSDTFPIHNSLKEEAALSSLLSNFVLGQALRKVRGTQMGLKWYGTHQLLVYADDVNLLWDNINTVKKSTEALFDASKDVVLEVNAEKTKYMLLSRHQNAGRNYNMKVANRSFDNVSQFTYLGTFCLLICCLKT